MTLSSAFIVRVCVCVGVKSATPAGYFKSRPELLKALLKRLLAGLTCELLNMRIFLLLCNSFFRSKLAHARTTNTHTQAFLFMTLIVARIFPRQSSLSKAQSSAKRSEKAAERGVREKGKSHLHKSAQYSANKAPIYLRINHTPTIKAGDPSVGVTTELGLCGGFVFFFW